jgi:hypothetical protein
MRFTAFIALFLLIPFSVKGQAASPDTARVSRIEYTRIDEISKRQTSFLSGERSQVSFYFIEIANLDTDESLEAVEVTISETEQEVAGGSLGLAALGSLWGTSAEVTFRRIQSSGRIVLTAKEVSEVINFLNSVIGALGKAQERFKVYRIALQDRFELGMMYDPDYSPSYTGRSEGERPASYYWQFTVTADGVTYTLDFQDGVDVLRTLTRWNDEMQGAG